MNNSNISDRDLNLSTHRQSGSVWERRGWDGTRDRLAISRLLVGVGGSALAIQALRSRRLMLAGIGGSLAWWALTGEGDLNDARRWFDRVLEGAPWHRGDDQVHQASVESFPASDAPAWTPTVGSLPKRQASSRD